MMFYFYLGKMPERYLNEKVKVNQSFNVMALFSLVTQATIQTKLFFYKSKISQKEISVDNYLNPRITRDGLFR